MIANVDPQRVVTELLPPERRSGAGASELERRTPSLSGFVWAFGLAGPPPSTSVHTLYLGRDPADEFRAHITQAFGVAT